MAWSDLPAACLLFALSSESAAALTQGSLLGSITGADSVTGLNGIENGLTLGDLVDVAVMTLLDARATSAGTAACRTRRRRCDAGRSRPRVPSCRARGF